jgi:hypothetical protein
MLPRASIAAALLAASSGHAQSIPGAVLAKNEPHHHVAYEDSVLRVLRVRVGGHDTTLLHEHDPDYFWIALGASEVVNARPGVPDAVIKSPDLSVHYTPGTFAHVARNPGASPFDNITVELLGDQTDVRNLCETAVAGRPLDCARSTAEGAWAQGATEHPAFVTSQLRVALLTIAPRAVLQPTEHSTGAWVIALDTVETPALAIAGAGAWIGGVYHPLSGDWSIRNRGSRPARVIAVVSIP